MTTAVAGRALPPPRNLPLPPRRRRRGHPTALAQVGDPYQHAAAGPDAFDCSGLTMYAYAAAGHLAAALQPRAVHAGHPGVARPSCSPATWSSSTRRSATSASTSATGMMVHARTYGSPVAVTSVDQRGFRFGVRLG